MDCWITPNTTIGPPQNGTPYWQFNSSLSKHATCTETTYLRPDIAGSILPWPYTMMWLLIHAPLVLIRVARWEKVQALSLFLAAVGIAFTIQAYSSTQRKPEEILVWTPLMIILDIGAVMQLIFLVVESSKGENVNGFVPLWDAFTDMMAGIFGRSRSRAQGLPEAKTLANDEEDKTQETSVQIENVNTSTTDSHHRLASDATAVEPVATNLTQSTRESSNARQLRGKAIIVVLSVLLFIGLITLQIMGLVSAINGLSSHKNLTSSWCSPMFQSFAIAVADGNCRLYNVTSSASKGIGCITLSGAQQVGWLTGTVVALAASLVFELVDLLVLALVESGTKWREVKMRRPWCTMFAGVVILIFYMIYGVLNSSRLPSGMTEVVWVFRKEPSLGLPTVCRGVVTASGIRGSLMGWTDGFLSSWGRVYFG